MHLFFVSTLPMPSLQKPLLAATLRGRIWRYLRWWPLLEQGLQHSSYPLLPASFPLTPEGLISLLSPYSTSRNRLPGLSLNSSSKLHPFLESFPWKGQPGQDAASISRSSGEDIHFLRYSREASATSYGLCGL